MWSFLLKIKDILEINLMASSEQLSQIHRNMDLPSRQKKAGEILYSIQKIVGQTLSDKYDLIIKQIKSIDVEEAFKTLPYKPCPFESKNPFATPDGGILQLKLDHYWFTLTISEHKSQGLRQNDTQAKGNAIERGGKNTILFEQLFYKENIFPYVMFCRGWDFDKGSSIIDRVAVIARGTPRNTVNVHKTNNLGGMSWFCQPQSFSQGQLYDVLYNITEKSIKYYMNKYKVI